MAKHAQNRIKEGEFEGQPKDMVVDQLSVVREGKVMLKWVS
ncbi:unnamed protein product [Acidithrix sp. C25]|nr:unnamed protein product [Acidithrix sp. C25]